MSLQQEFRFPGSAVDPVKMLTWLALALCLHVGAAFGSLESAFDSVLEQSENGDARDVGAWQRKTAESHGLAPRFRDCASCPEMTVIPSAVSASHPQLPLFAGQPPELEQITQAFAISVTPVTFEQFRRFEAALGIENPAPAGFVAGGRGFCESMLYAAHMHYPSGSLGVNRSRPYPESSISPAHPVVCVDLLEVQAYLDWLSDQSGYRYRLPTEAEWEFAARAGASTRFWWGDQPDPGCRRSHVLAVVWSDNWRQLDSACPTDALGAGVVALREANAFGLHDVVGNVWEWTASCADAAPLISIAATTYDLHADQSLCEAFVTRGGSLDTSLGSLELSAKKIWPPLRPGNLLGFRVVRDL